MNTNTAESFLNKWNNNPDVAFTETLREDSEIFKWILNRNGFHTHQELTNFLADKKRILDAGCGNGRVTALLRNYSNPQTTEIVGIDLVSAQVAKKNLQEAQNVSIDSADLLEDLNHLGLFDFIYCQEVLHHTSDPQKAFLNLTSLLSENGEIAIYVYKKKAPVREFVDDFIRDRISTLAYNDAIKASTQLTELGKILSELKINISVPQIDTLEIPAGEYDLQRFMYHFFLKCFWNSDLTYHENTVINYDWYHPQLCSRHTLEEVHQWFVNAGLEIVHSFTDFYGITVRGHRKHE